MENMEKTKASDFRYNTGEARIPWAAVGENYNADDVLRLIRFLIQENDDEYKAVLKRVEEDIRELSKHGRPPGKLSLGDNVSRF